MNCIDNDCKYLFTQLGNWYCNIKRCEIPDDIDITQCDDFVQARTCINCKHSEIIDCYDNVKITDNRILKLMCLINRITNHNYLTNLVIEGESIDEIKEEILKEYIERKDIIPIQLVQEIFNV